MSRSRKLEEGNRLRECQRMFWQLLPGDGRDAGARERQIHPSSPDDMTPVFMS
jgi:hypothetical protein